MNHYSFTPSECGCYELLGSTDMTATATYADGYDVYLNGTIIETTRPTSQDEL